MVASKLGINVDFALSKDCRVSQSLITSFGRQQLHRLRQLIKNFQFNLSAPRATKVTVGEAWAATVTVDYNFPGGHNYAISSIPLHQSCPFQWQVEIVHLPDYRGWMMLGVIGNPQPSSYSYDDRTSFGWCSNNSVVVAGIYRRTLGFWDGWLAGDRGVFTYSPSEATLSLRLLRGDVREFSIDISRLPDGAGIHTLLLLLYWSNCAILKGCLDKCS